MLQNRISGLPVIDAAGKLVGIVTEGDFLRRSEIGTAASSAELARIPAWAGRLAEEYVRTHGRKVDEVMTPDPVQLAKTIRWKTVVELMERHRVKRLPVMRGDGMVGIVSRANLMHALASLARDDDACRGRFEQSATAF